MSRITHYLTIYDGTTEECLDALPFSSFDLTAFRLQFDVSEDDPEMVDRYSVTPLDETFILSHIEVDATIFNFSEYAYFVEAVRS